MKKIYLAALTLAMTACVSNDDLNPVENYGYIDLNVSNDPIVETKAVQINGKSWIVKIGETEYTGSTQAFNAGTYNVTVKTHDNVEAAVGTNTDWGQSYYDNIKEQNQDQVIVVAGTTTPKTIECGTAKNTRVKVAFTQQFTSVFPTYKLNITNPKTLEFNSTTTDKYAYFQANENIDFTITYKKTNQESATTTDSKSLELGAAGTEKVITVTANTAGNIQLNITTSEFENVDGETITFDAATGDQVETPIQGN